MRFLLDEMLDEGLVLVLRGLGHDAVHVKKRYRNYTDVRLARIARRYDAFITLNLHRQESEWLAVYSEMVYGRIKVVRIQLPKRTRDVRLDVLRTLIASMELWLVELDAGACLITLSNEGKSIRARSRREVLEMIRARLEGTSQPLQLPMLELDDEGD